MSGTFNRSDIRPGMWKFDDRNGDKVIDDSDMSVIGNANPDFYGGLNNQFKYKGWDFNFFFTFSYGGEVLNATKLTNTKTATTNYSVLNIADSSNRWMTVNSEGQLITDPEEMAAINAGRTVACIYDMEAGDKYIHSWAVEDASYLRLKNATVSYTFDLRKKTRLLRDITLAVTGENLWLWTKYNGFDPDVSSEGTSSTLRRVDMGAYPRSRMFVFSIQLRY